MKMETTMSRANLAALPALDPERRRFVAAASLLALAGCGGGSVDDDPDRAGEAADAGRDAKSAPVLAPDAALAVVSSVPGDGGNNQPRTRQPSFTFSSLLNAASVNGGNFSLRAGEATVPAAIRVIDRVARLEPEAKLLPQTQFTVRATPGILDTFGHTLAGPVQRSFVTADGAWGALQVLPGERERDQGHAAAAIDPRGDAWVVWTEFAGDLFRLKLQRFEAASASWAPAFNLGAPAAHFEQVQMAFDHAGNGVLTWVQPRDPQDWRLSSEVWASRYDAGARLWEQPRKLSSAFGNGSPPTHRSVRLAVRGSGDIVIAWVRSEFTGSYVEATTRTAHGDWRPPVLVGVTPSDFIESVDVALAPTPNGAVAFVWTDWRSSDRPQSPVLLAAHWTSPTHWARPEVFQVSTADWILSAQVRIDRAGVTHVVWLTYPARGGPKALWARQSKTSGWTEPRRVSSVDEDSTGYSLATNMHSPLASTWVSWLGAANRVKAVRLRTDGGADTPQLLGRIEPPRLPSLSTMASVDGAGNVLVAWTEGQPRTAADVKVARFVGRLGEWQAVRTLDSATLASPDAPSLAMNASGDALAMWRHALLDAQGRSERAIAMRRFE